MATKHAVGVAAALLFALVSPQQGHHANSGKDPASCGQELQGKQFRDCQRFLSPHSHSLLEMVAAQGKRPAAALLECCRQLQGVRQECRCEAIRQAAKLQQERQMGSGGSWSPEQVEQVKERFSQIPGQCGMRKHECQLRAVFVAV